MDDFLTVTEFATILKVSRQTVINWIDANKIKFATMPGGQYRIPKTELNKILEVK